MDMKLFGLPYKIRNRVVEFEEGRLIAWRHFGGHRWRYELDAGPDGGTRVTETFDYSRYNRVGAAVIRLAGFPERNRRGIEETLVRLKAAAEAGRRPRERRLSAAPGRHVRSVRSVERVRSIRGGRRALRRRRCGAGLHLGDGFLDPGLVLRLLGLGVGLAGEPDDGGTAEELHDSTVPTTGKPHAARDPSLVHAAGRRPVACSRRTAPTRRLFTPYGAGRRPGPATAGGARSARGRRRPRPARSGWSWRWPAPRPGRCRGAARAWPTSTRPWSPGT